MHRRCILVAALLIACSADVLAQRSATSNRAPVSRPGGPYIVTSGSVITVDGSASTDDVGIVWYRWRVLKGTTSSALIDETVTVPRAVFLPPVPPGSYILQLVVTDTNGVARAANTLLTVQLSPAPTPTPPPTVATYDSIPALVQALPTAADGTVLQLRASTYTGNLILPARTAPGRVTVTTYNCPSSGSIGMAEIRSPSNEPALSAAPRASGYTIKCLILSSTNIYGEIVTIGDPQATDCTMQPRDIVFDGIIVRGDPVLGVKRGIALHGSNLTVTNSRVVDVKSSEQDAQAIWMNNGPGPYIITNNYLEGSGENVLTGGAVPGCANMTPSDITFTGNTVVHPLAWQNESWNVKNLLELKNARRVTIRNNVFDGNWVKGQVGYAIVFTPRQVDSGAWAVVEDIVFDSNIVRNSAAGVNILGVDEDAAGVTLHRVSIQNNLFLTDGPRFGGGPGECMLVGRGPKDVSFVHNTCIMKGARAAIYSYSDGAPLVTGFTLRDNLFSSTAYHFMGGNSSSGLPSLTMYYESPTFQNNVFAGDASMYKWPATTRTPTQAAFEAEFVDYAGGQFVLKDTSTFKGAGTGGSDLGADVSSLPR